MSVNKVILIGNLGKDPEVRYLEGGVPVANFTLATSEKYNKNGEKVTQTEWHNIVLWRGLAEVAEKYLKKGNQVYIEGKLRTRSWEDQTGNKRYTTEIVADTMTMLGGAKDTGYSQPGVNSSYNEVKAPSASSVSANSDSVSQALDTPMDDDLPF